MTEQIMFAELAPGGAVLTSCGRYRYRLWRDWGGSRVLGWLLLNPSTADGQSDDPTVRKLCRFARRWGYGRIEIVNLFGWRARHPADLPDELGLAIGPDNDQHISAVLASVETIICGWGRNGSWQHRDLAAFALIKAAALQPMALKINDDGTPAHPLYLPDDAEPALLATETA